VSTQSVVAPLLDSLSRGRLPATGRLAGQRVVLKRTDCSGWICLDSRDGVHFLLSPAPADTHRFGRFGMRLLTFGAQEWVISKEKAGRYLDISCTATRNSAMRRPFLGFCEDLIQDLGRTSVSPDEAAYKAALRWQRFWAAGIEDSVTDSWIRGLAAELMLLKKLISWFGPSAVRSWSGPEGHDQDFQSGGVAIEVKATTTEPAILMVNNLGQLDSAPFKGLYLVVFHMTDTPKSLNLPGLVRDIETRLRSQDDACDLFWRRLGAAGYLRHLEGRYAETNFSVDRVEAYTVGGSFPKLTVRDFKTRIDSRIREVRYSVRLTGLTGMDGNGVAFRKLIARGFAGT
jgi:hypothetical protein